MSQRSETPLNHHQEQRLLFGCGHGQWRQEAAGRGHWRWVVCCSDTILSIGKCVGLKLITLTQHYTNLSLISILLITAMMKENIHLALNR